MLCKKWIGAAICATIMAVMLFGAALVISSTTDTDTTKKPTFAAMMVIEEFYRRGTPTAMPSIIHWKCGQHVGLNSVKRPSPHSAAFWAESVVGILHLFVDTVLTKADHSDFVVSMMDHPDNEKILKKNLQLAMLPTQEHVGYKKSKKTMTII